jgi:hypothetical protein
MNRLNRLRHIQRRWSSMAWLWTAGMIVFASIYGVQNDQAGRFLIMVIVSWAARDVVSALECFLITRAEVDEA